MKYSPILWGMSSCTHPIPPATFFNAVNEKGGFPRRTPDFFKRRAAEYVCTDTQADDACLLDDSPDSEAFGCLCQPRNICINSLGEQMAFKVEMMERGLSLFVDHLGAKAAKSADTLFEFVLQSEDGMTTLREFAILSLACFNPKLQTFTLCHLLPEVHLDINDLQSPFELEISCSTSRVSAQLKSISHETSAELCSRLAAMGPGNPATSSIKLFRLNDSIGGGLASHLGQWPQSRVQVV